MSYIRFSRSRTDSDYKEQCYDNKVIWDDTIAVIRVFQAAFKKCVQSTFTAGTFSRWLNLMNSNYISIENIAGRYIDFLNIKYLNINPEKRVKALSGMARRIAEFTYDDDHREIQAVVKEGARKYQCETGEIGLQGIEYPEDFQW